MNADDRHSPVRARVLDEAIAWQLLLDSGEAHPETGLNGKTRIIRK